MSDRRSPRRLASGAARVFREGGLRGVAGAVIADTVFRRLALFERRLATGGAVAAPSGLEFRFLEASDVPAYAALRPDDAGSAAERLRDGSRCFGSWLDGELVSVRWVATGRPLVGHLGLPLPLRTGEAYTFDSYTSPAHRRRGISAASQERLFDVLAAEGYGRIVRTVLPENRPAVRDALRGGYRRTGTIGYVRAGPWRHPFLRRREL